MRFHRIIEMFAICRQLHLSYSVQKYSFYFDYEKKNVFLHLKKTVINILNTCKYKY